MARGAWLAAIQFGLNIGFAQGQPRWAAIDNAANGRAMRFAKGGNSKQGAKVLPDMFSSALIEVKQEFIMTSKKPSPAPLTATKVSTQPAPRKNTALAPANPRQQPETAGNAASAMAGIVVKRNGIDRHKKSSRSCFLWRYAA
jgi:hypothetical protein